MKACSWCKLVKPLEDFYREKSKKDGRTSRCRSCVRMKVTEWDEANPGAAVVRAVKWNKDNPNRRTEINRKYNTANVESIRANARRYESEKRLTDIQFKLKKALRSRMKGVLKQRQKTGSAIADLGISLEGLIAYLESLFQPGMTWDNWSVKGWHIDHIIPLASFDLTDREQFLRACHYTNLQPLWAKDNLAKSDNLNWKRAA